jgi:two-component system heavy metal sensor histidine kinase CusS
MRGLSTRSIRFRLTLWYALAMAVALGLFGSLIWFSMRQQLYREIDSALAVRAARFEAYLTREAAEVSSAEQLRDELEEFSQGLPAADVVDLTGSLGFTFHYPPPTGPARRRRLRIAERTFVADGETFQLRLSTSVEDARHTLELLQALLLGLMPVAIAISCLAGVWLSSRALKPVVEVTRAARSIGIDNLSERLPVPGTGDELQRLTETWNEMLARLETAVSTLSQFAADASHELRTPLAVIRTSAELALRRERSPEEYRESLRGIEAEAERMSQLVENLLFLARSEAQPAELPKEPVDLRQVAEDAAREMRAVAEARGVRIRVTAVGVDSTSVFGNRPALTRLVVVLLDNAVKYSPPDSEVTVELTSRDRASVIKVQDFGAGIAPADQPHIFKRFYRADPARSNAVSDAGGFGLGLALAESIAAAHGAKIGVESRPGAGSIFRVVFPAAVAEAEAARLTMNRR